MKGIYVTVQQTIQQKAMVIIVPDLQFRNYTGMLILLQSKAINLQSNP